MKNSTYKSVTSDGNIKRKNINTKEQLNYGYADLLNSSELNEYQLPIHYCDPNLYPDFIALNTQKGLYHLTPLTALAFYSYDRTFDNINGLYNAIQYNNRQLLEKFKKKYEGIQFVIGPDYSLFDDVWEHVNRERLFRIRIIMLWFVLEMNAIVIPNAIYLSVDRLPIYLSGFENCSIMCFSTKGHIRYAKERNRIKETVKYVVDHFKLKTILVYSVCGKDEKSLKLFSYAIKMGIKVIIVDNVMRQRNQALSTKRGELL